MDGQGRRHGQAQTWNHASTGGASPMRPLDGSALRPLAPLAPMPSPAQGRPEGPQPGQASAPQQPQGSAGAQPPFRGAPMQGAPQPAPWQGAQAAATPQYAGPMRQPQPGGMPSDTGAALQPPFSGAPQPNYGMQPPPYGSAVPQPRYQSAPQPTGGMKPPQLYNASPQPQGYAQRATYQPTAAQPWQGAQAPAHTPNVAQPQPWQGDAPQRMPALQPRQATQAASSLPMPPQADPASANQPPWLPDYIQPETLARRSQPQANGPSAIGQPPAPVAPQTATYLYATPSTATATDAPGNRSPAGAIYAQRETAAPARLEPAPPQPQPRQAAAPVAHRAAAPFVPSAAESGTQDSARRRRVMARPAQAADSADEDIGWAQTPKAGHSTQTVANAAAGVAAQASAFYGAQPEAYSAQSLAYGVPPETHSMQPQAYEDPVGAYEGPAYEGPAYESPAYGAQAGWLPEGEPEALYPFAETDAPDEDSGRYPAAEQAPLAEPAVVPIPYMPTAKRRRKGRGGLVALAAVLLLGAAGAGLYYTGLLGKLYSMAFPQATGGLPAVFAGGAAGDAGVTPAAQAGQPRLLAATVAPAEASAPAELVFTLQTNTDTSSVRLLTEDNATIHTTAYSTPKGDGLAWEVTATFTEPYTGKVRVFLRDAAGQWSVGETACDVAVR